MYINKMIAKISLPNLNFKPMREQCQFVGPISFCMLVIIIIILSCRNRSYPYQSPARTYDEFEIPGLGDMGEEAKIENNAKSEYSYNAWISERISLRRRLPEMADIRCFLNSINDSSLPKASIIITYRNEHPTIFLRALYSIFKRSPDHLIEDVILVEDDSGSAFLHHASYTVLLNKHFGKKVKHLRFDKYTLGATSASYFGAKHAKGQILIFLNAAIEVTLYWLPFLLAPIVNDSKTVTLPSIDYIDPNTFKYSINSNERGGFDWALNHKFLELMHEQRQAYPEPYQNPLMNVPMFAINAQWYHQMEAYDSGLRRSEAENFEWSFRLWMCGGQVLEVPCSRIGIVNKNVRYAAKNMKTYKDYKRVVEVWLDEYKDIVYEKHAILKIISTGDISSQKNFRKHFQCKPFHWFMTHIMPDFLKVYPRFIPNTYGALRSLGNLSLCLSNRHNYNSDGIAFVRLSECPNRLMGMPNVFVWNLCDQHQLRQGYHCLKISSNRPVADLLMTLCYKNKKQSWHYDNRTQMLEYITKDESKLCLEADITIFDAFANTCDYNNPNQRWIFGDE